jgi:hypothetical protein
MTELEIDAFTCGFRCNAYLSSGSEDLLCPFALMGIHAAVDFTGAETPPFKVISHIAQGVAVLRENQELPPSILQLKELRLAKALFQCSQF